MGFAKAAAAILQGVAPRVQDTYTNAANADAGYARGLGDQTQGAINQQAASDNAFLQKMGTPTGGLVHPANVGDAAYGLEGYIPASTLQREGAGFGAAAQMLPGDTLRQGQQQASATLNDTTNIAQLQSELAKLAATKPEVYQKILTTLEGFGFRKAELAQAQQRIGISQQSLALRGQYEQASLGLRAQAQAQSAMNENRNYGLALKRLGLEGKRFQLEAMKAQAKYKASAKGGGFTPDELVHIRGQAGQIASNSFHGGKLSDGSPDPRLPGLNYKQAFKQEILAGIPPSLAIQALKEAGFKPGVRGTPRNVSNLQKTLIALTLNPGGATSSKAQNAIVNLAHQYMGTPYVWGGESPKGFDCSGFAQYLYGKVGINIPRTTYTQWTARNGKAVGKGQLQPGDLVFFRGSDSKGGLPGHVGVYIGNGQMIDAPHTGASVRIESVANFGGYMGARRYH